jgi:glycosyltransferase involved in cell wall biosynthesis
MDDNSRVLILLGAFLPGYKSGGPVASIAHLTARLGDEFAFSILTADRDLGDTEPYPDLPRDRWIEAHGARLRYCSPQALTPRRLTETIRRTPHDLLYLNSFFEAQFTIAPLVARRLGLLQPVPALLAPRGEFSPGALALKARKKHAYTRAGSAVDLFRALHWHASSDHEANDIRTAMGVSTGKIAVASDLAAPLPAAPPPHEPRAPGDPLRVLFLSRLSPKKNLDYALDVLSRVTAAVRFTIHGPEEDAGYASRCRALARALPPQVTVNWAGPLSPADVPQVMAGHDLFFLPTRGENFGHVIAEALGAGTPVLLSDTTPWRGLAALGIGHDLPLEDPTAFRDVIEQAWSQHPQDADQTRSRAAAFARQRQSDSAEIEANRSLFRNALAGGRQLQPTMRQASIE